jgi:hypothetical protein
MNRNATLTCLTVTLVAGSPSIASAQEPPPAAGAPGEPGGASPNVTIVQVPPAAAPAAPSYPGALPPAGFNPDSYLPSSAHSSSDASSSHDTFDLVPKDDGASSVRGSASGAYIMEGQYVPESHTVHRGETLWEISGHFYSNPYRWPQLWAQNPQIQNPHWIYPGDRVRLREAGGPTLGNLGHFGQLRKRMVPPQTIFLREVGWVDDRSEDTWGQVIGSPTDQMLLGTGSDIYVRIEDGHEISIGEELTIFLPLRAVQAENSNGTLVSIRGTARVDRYNAKTRTARARIIEALDVIERGARVGPVGRRFDVVPPIVSDRDLDANILASVYPDVLYGQNQVLFIDRGDRDGVKPGMRFFIVMRGDRWLRAIHSAGQLATERPRVEDDRPDKVDDMPTAIDNSLLPDETYGEVRVLSTRDHSAAVLVTGSRHEIERNAKLVARKGM